MAKRGDLGLHGADGGVDLGGRVAQIARLSLDAADDGLLGFLEAAAEQADFGLERGDRGIGLRRRRGTRRLAQGENLMRFVELARQLRDVVAQCVDGWIGLVLARGRRVMLDLEARSGEGRSVEFALAP